MAAVELITPAEYARRRGVTRAAVSIAIKSGRITSIDGKIDPMVADIQWDANTRKVVGRGSRSFERQPNAPGDGAAQSADAATDRISRGAYLSPPEYDYDAARAKREHHEAILAELKESERKGQLVDVSKVRMAIADIARILADGLERIPDRVSVQIHANMTSANIHAQLERELSAVRHDLQTAIAELPARLKPSTSA